MTMNENDENRMLSFEEEKQLAIEMWEAIDKIISAIHDLEE